MNSEQMITNHGGQIPDEAWDVFLPDDDAELMPDEGDFWSEPWDDEE